MLKVNDLQVYYGVINAIKGVSFEVNEGEVIALIGANGAGKTTILYTITLSLEIFNAVSRADFDAANALCLLLSLFAAVIFLAAELLSRRNPRL